MKVKSIGSYQGADGRERWRVNFEDDTRPLILFTQPSYQVGADIPAYKLTLISKGDTQYYVLAREPKRTFGKSQEELSQSAKTMCLAYAKDLAVAGRIEVSQVIPQAEEFLKWVKS